MKYFIYTPSREVKNVCQYQLIREKGLSRSRVESATTRARTAETRPGVSRLAGLPWSGKLSETPTLSCI